MDEQRDSIVSILEQKKSCVQEDRDTLAPLIIGVQNLLERYYSKDNAFVKQAEVLHHFITALQTSKKDQYPLYTRCNIKDIAFDLKALIDAVKDEIVTVGLPNSSKTKASNGIQITNNLNQSQNQSQEQNVIVNILLDAVKDELTGRQWKELLAVAKETTNPVESRKRVLDKIKSFGEGIASNIVANIVTNPEVWQSLGSFM